MYEKIRINKENRKKLSLGHKERDQGCGSHGTYKQERLNKTRASQRKRWKDEYDEQE